MTTSPTEWIPRGQTADVIRVATARKHTVDDVAAASGIPIQYLYAVLAGDVRGVPPETHEIVVRAARGLRDLTTRSLPIDPLLPLLDMQEDGVLSATDRRAVLRARKSGRISVAVADRLCTLIGWHIDLVWPDEARAA